QKDKLKQLARQYPIVIACRYFADTTIPNVTIDNIKAIKDITGYLLNLGHKRVCYLAGPSDILLYQDRLGGFREALRERDIALDPDLILHCDSSIRGGYDAVSALLNARRDFTALVASGDTMAIGAIRALNDAGLRVPEDVAVAGFDDISMSTLFTPTLTTVRQPKYQIGARAMEKLLDLISGKELSNWRDVLNYELVIRESSGGLVSAK
ncbi:MAG: substrate-binding domain-containing protein, partial [Oscillospiraceae bacterium]|nr:substrate-binding domain-containing protein [Oscillospiraceae bacterium]